MKDLRCPYCGGSLSVELETVGPAYMTYDRVEFIECESNDCGATWEPNGDARALPWKDRP